MARTSKGSSEKTKKFKTYWFPVIIWALVIFSFSSLPTKKVADFYLQDFLIKKTAHVVEFAIFATLFYRAIVAYGIFEKMAGGYSVLVSFVYGATDEFHQSFTPGREPRARDVVFDTIGATLAIYIIWKYLPTAPKKLKNWAKRWQLI